MHSQGQGQRAWEALWNGLHGSQSQCQALPPLWEGRRAPQAHPLHHLSIRHTADSPSSAPVTQKS